MRWHPQSPAALVIDSKGFYDAAAPKQLPLEYAIAKEETMKKQHMLPFWVNNLRMAANCLTKRRGETKILYEILEMFFFAKSKFALFPVVVKKLEHAFHLPKVPSLEECDNQWSLWYILCTPG